MTWRRGRAYSDDLRERVLTAEGSARTVAARFGVSPSYVIKARQRRDRTGETRARKARQTQVRRLAGHEEALRAEVARRIDATLAELRGWLRTDRGVQVGITVLWRELVRLGLTLKKSRCEPPSRTGRIWSPHAPHGGRRRVA
jgi:transposase